MNRIATTTSHTHTPSSHFPFVSSIQKERSTRVQNQTIHSNNNNNNTHSLSLKTFPAQSLAVQMKWRHASSLGYEITSWVVCVLFLVSSGWYASVVQDDQSNWGQTLAGCALSTLILLCALCYNLYLRRRARGHAVISGHNSYGTSARVRAGPVEYGRIDGTDAGSNWVRMRIKLTLCKIPEPSYGRNSDLGAYLSENGDGSSGVLATLRKKNQVRSMSLRGDMIVLLRGDV